MRNYPAPFERPVLILELLLASIAINSLFLSPSSYLLSPAASPRDVDRVRFQRMP